MDYFDFSEGVTFTEFTLNIDYPNGSMFGKEVLTEIRFIDTGMPPLVEFDGFEGSRITKTIPVLNSYIQGSSTRILVTSYLFDNPDDMNFDAGLFGGLPAAYMSGSYFSESTKNPWREENIFTLTRDTEGQEFTITFPQRMNIKMAHENFTNNNPVISWNSYPGASGYFVMVIVQERNENPNKDTFSGSDLWEVAFYGYTRDANITVFSERITFDTVYTSEAAIEAQIKQGDFIRVEVYALDGFGTLDTKTKKGVLAMDSVNIIR